MCEGAKCEKYGFVYDGYLWDRCPECGQLNMVAIAMITTTALLVYLSKTVTNKNIKFKSAPKGEETNAKKTRLINLLKFFLEGMAVGVEICKVKTKPCKVVSVIGDTFRIILTQGLNKQIRRMCKAFGYKVIRLERIRIKNF